jgi:radical SAM/Cys-rich protein
MKASIQVRVPTAAPQTIGNELFAVALHRHGLPRLTRAPLSTLQVNLGRLCNQACEHCHVDAGPKRTEIMSWPTMRGIIDWSRENGIRDFDITGGAPEMIPHFREFVDECLGLGAKVGVRCNLTILLESGYEDLHHWYAKRGISLTCSLPCYSKENTDGQRGKGVFDRSIEALQRLNSVGYGIDPALCLDLVYNPGGAFLPPPQAALEKDYKRELSERFGISFNRLLALANLPINRFEHFLKNNGQLESYRQLLIDAFNPDTVPALMCRHLLSVDWLGQVYDCDFNQMLEMPIIHDAKRPKLWDVDVRQLEHSAIAVGEHCFGCTAGAGSSCGGSLS